MTGLADVDGIKICIQDCMSSDHYKSTVVKVNVTSMILDHKYLPEASQVKDTNRSCPVLIERCPSVR